MAEPPIPVACDVLVIGAGPAGSACAQRLARDGLDVLIADQHAFPRDKVCGDGLIPDAHAALRRLGVYDEVAALAQHVPHVRCIGPRGRHVDVPGSLSVLPRRTLDHVLLRAAERAGARMLPPLRFETPLLDRDRVVGARFKRVHSAAVAASAVAGALGPTPADPASVGPGAVDAGAVDADATHTGAAAPSTTHDIHARWVVLATGAVPQALISAGLCDRRTPSGVALRGYVRHPGLAPAITQLQVVWHPRLRGGYGWIFPAPGGVFNIGTGLTGSHRETRGGRARMQDVNLRDMLDAFCEVYAPAAELMRDGEVQGEFKGAPLRCSLRGARWSRPGLLVTGEAAGTTYAFTGEGIGKAMETGLLAAEVLLQQGGADEAEVRRRYDTALAGLAPKFELYELGARVNQHPWLADLVIWRARRSPGILRRMTGLLEETVSPGHLFSWRGVTRLMFE